MNYIRENITGLAIIIFIAGQTWLVNNSVACQTQITAEPVAMAEPMDVTLDADDSAVTVKIGNELFTTFDGRTYNKPILYPIYGPGQISMTRNWPMKDGVEGEAHDHPHHKSLWIGTEISGVDFWGEKGGKVVTSSVETEFADNPGNGFRATSDWLRKSDGQKMLTDQTTYGFGGDANSRWIDCTIHFMATDGDFQFDDTKEGLFAIRTHPDLRLSAKPKQGVTEVFGTAVNSAGDSGKAIWGKPAKWLLYQGPIDGSPMSIAMFDHPQNLRYPTTWHARDYGLVAANPFGLHHFLGQEKGSGAFIVKNGDSLVLRYRIEFIRGNASTADIESRYQAFAKSPVIELNSR